MNPVFRVYFFNQTQFYLYHLKESRLFSLQHMPNTFPSQIHCRCLSYIFNVFTSSLSESFLSLCYSLKKFFPDHLIKSNHLFSPHYFLSQEPLCTTYKHLSILFVCLFNQISPIITISIKTKTCVLFTGIFQHQQRVLHLLDDKKKLIKIQK